MEELLRFISRNKLLLIFLFLQYLCFVLIYRNNEHHQGVMLSSASEMVGGMSSARADVKNYLSLSEQNDSLAKRVAELESSMRASYRVVDNDFVIMDDTLLRKRFYYQKAKVIQNTVNFKNNYITIDRGSAQDVKKDMVVRSNEGLVGIVDRTSANYALIRPIIHPKFNAGARISQTRNIGLLKWDGQDYRVAQLGDIPTEVNISEGDLVLTRGVESSSYPSGIPIGRILRTNKEEGASFYEIDVELSVDFSKLHFVYIIGDEFVDELDSLKKFMIQDE